MSKYKGLYMFVSVHLQQIDKLNIKIKDQSIWREQVVQGCSSSCDQQVLLTS